MVSNHEKKVAKLRANYRAGELQIERMLPDLKRFLEL